jgi:hypothetical protein
MTVYTGISFTPVAVPGKNKNTSFLKIMEISIDKIRGETKFCACFFESEARQIAGDEPLHREDYTYHSFLSSPFNDPTKVYDLDALDSYPEKVFIDDLMTLESTTYLNIDLKNTGTIETTV